MLLLSRKKGERIFLCREGQAPIIITLCSQKARLGIEAPPDVVILREELMSHASPEVEVTSDDDEVTVSAN
jgi:sRNA-binding carbon storage regulator CsrA